MSARAGSVAFGVEDLLAIIETGEFHRNGRMRVVSAHWSADRLALRLQVDHGTGQNSAWQLRFTGVLEYVLAEVSNCGLNIWRDDHPAIAQYIDAREFLYFAASPKNPDQVVGKLWSAHRALVDDWIPFDRYVDCEQPLDQRLASGSGVVATGPAFLLSSYAAVLEEAGCEPTRKELRAARPARSAVLAHFGESYVIAEQIATRRLPT